MKIEQVCVANCLKFFKKGFIDRWKLSDYHDKDAPCIFIGAEQPQDINNHRGLKIIYIASEYDTSFLRYITPGDNIIIHDTPFRDNCIGFRIKRNVEIELKDYSIYKPNVLGDKVYTYLGTPDRGVEFGIDRVVNICKQAGYELIIGISDSVNNYQSSDSLKEKFYDKCFVNINLSRGTGMTTVRELGLMGRRTITNSEYGFPSQIGYFNDDDIVRLINEEAKKIGTIQTSIDCHTVKDEWLNVDFWLK